MNKDSTPSLKVLTTKTFNLSGEEYRKMKKPFADLRKKYNMRFVKGSNSYDMKWIIKSEVIQATYDRKWNPMIRKDETVSVSLTWKGYQESELFKELVIIIVEAKK